MGWFVVGNETYGCSGCARFYRTLGPAAKQMSQLPTRLTLHRHGLAWLGHPRLCCQHEEKTWMVGPTTGSSPVAMAHPTMTMKGRPLRYLEHLFGGGSLVVFLSVLRALRGGFSFRPIRHPDAARHRLR
ncbi:hypothetical protein SBBP1_1500001 [Burkholderiales bacterium]|nr:hypothetical protein SBBP1_1500001 [Burkholderiales bacterium]